MIVAQLPTIRFANTINERNIYTKTIQKQNRKKMSNKKKCQRTIGDYGNNNEMEKEIKLRSLTKRYFQLFSRQITMYSQQRLLFRFVPFKLMNGG